MTIEKSLTNKTRWNWIVDLVLFMSALLSSVSGLYFLFAPHEGFRGGRNAAADTFLALSKSSWKDIHVYSGLLMIAIAIYHVVRHWDWIKCTLRHIWKEITGACRRMNDDGWTNVIIDTILILAFIVIAVSGLYFYLLPHGGGRGAQAGQVVFLFSPAVWKWLHSWIGLTFVIAALLHLVVHWGWIVRVTRKMMGLSITMKTTYPDVLG